MRRRVLLCLTLISLSACNGDSVVKPTVSPASPTNAISDATHSALGYTSNPDFFFLPPMVGNPSSSPKWDAGAFNASLRPMVEICASAALTESTVGTSPCTPMPPALTAALDAGAEQYQVNWKVPTSSTIFYRITVKVGSTTLGFADVETASNASQLKNVATGEFIPLTDGRTLPIKFRIERYALCAVPGVGPCTSVSGDIAVAPVTVFTGTPDASGISTTVGVTIPVQSNAAATPVTVTITSCPNLNPAAIDLPTFGDCVRVTTDPQLDRLSNPATVFVCAVGVSASLFQGLSESQEARVTLHRYDASGPHAGVTALPHATACTPGNPGGIASAGPSFTGMLASLAHGQIGRAAKEAVALLAPKPLYAAMFIDLGGGGYTEFFSDFQFALPSKMEEVEGVDGQIVPPGTILAPTVRVTDLGGEPVKGAVVHFGTSDPSASAGTLVTTGADGLATSPWTIVEGSNTLPVSGRGIASPSANGPRRSVGAEIDDINDPFQPIQSHFDPGFTGTPSEVAVGTGSVTFTVTGRRPTGEIAGGVTNTLTGSPIAGAAITVSPTPTGMPTDLVDAPPVSVVTDAKGAFVVAGLLPGSYDVSTDVPGFFHDVRSAIAVVAGATTAFGNIPLAPIDAVYGSSPGGGTASGDLPGHVFVVNAATGVATPLPNGIGVQSKGGVYEVSAVAVDPTSGVLYGIVGSNCTGARLVTIDPQTGVGTPVSGGGSDGYISGEGFDGHIVTTDGCWGGADAMAFSTDGVLYVGGWNGQTTAYGKLLKVDKATAAVLELHTTPAPAGNPYAMSGLAFDRQGNLWVSHGSNLPGVLHRINLDGSDAGSLTLSLPGLIVSDLAFAPDGKLYLTLPRDDALATVDLSTGAVTRKANTFGNGVATYRLSGLTIRR